MGLLGGSFNPAHAGHLHVARVAQRRLRLHQVWLLVSPGNPLKPRAGMAPLVTRLADARALADGRRVLATAIEAPWRTRYAIDTMRLLRERFPRVRFVWLAGADILAELPRWRRWRALADRVPFAILPRRPHTMPSLAGLAARRLGSYRRPAWTAARLAAYPPPAWLLLPAALNPLSATAIRQQGSRP